MESINYISYKFKLYPTLEQEEIFNRYFGACRFVYNLGINLQKEQYQKSKEDKNIKYNSLSYYELDNKLRELKNNEDYKWLNDFNAFTLTLTLKDVRNAYDRFFKGISRYPKYKKKKNANKSFPVRYNRLIIKEDSVQLPNIGEVYCGNHNHPECIGTGYKSAIKHTYRHYTNARVIYDGCSYWITFSMEVCHKEGIEANSCKRFKNNEDWKIKNYSNPIGIDLGCKQKNWIVDSRGVRINKPDTSKEDIRIKKYQRKLAIKQKVNWGKTTNSTLAEAKRKQNYTKNEEKILKKLNKAYKRKTNKKKNAIHEYACSLIEDKPSCVILENLDINGMYIDKSDQLSYNQRKNHNRNIKDSMLYTVQTIIEHKCISNNIPVIFADREYPSSQLCSHCGHRQKIGISRIYKCPICNTIIDRDYNASLNLSYLGYNNYNQYDFVV